MGVGLEQGGAGCVEQFLMYMYVLHSYLTVR